MWWNVKPMCELAVYVATVGLLLAIIKGCNSNPAASPQQTTTDHKNYFQAYDVALINISCTPAAAQNEEIVAVKLENNKTGIVMAYVASGHLPVVTSGGKGWCVAKGNVNTSNVLSLSCLQCPVDADVAPRHPCNDLDTHLPSHVQQQLVCKAGLLSGGFFTQPPSSITSTRGVTLECSTEGEPDDVTNSDVTITLPTAANGQKTFVFRSSDPSKVKDQGADYGIYVRNLAKSENGTFVARTVIGLAVTVLSDDPQVLQLWTRHAKCTVQMGNALEEVEPHVLDDVDKPIAASGNYVVVAAVAVAVTAVVVSTVIVGIFCFKKMASRCTDQQQDHTQFNMEEYKKVTT